MNKKRILILVRSPPYAGATSYETLEAVLVAGVFEQAVTVVFMDDGVFQLVRNQDTGELGVRNVGKGLRALDTYDVKELYVDGASLQQRGLTAADLEVPAKPVDAVHIGNLIRLNDVVLTS